MHPDGARPASHNPNHRARLESLPIRLSPRRERVEVEENRHRRDEQEHAARYLGALDALEEARQAVPTFIVQSRKRLTGELSVEAIAAHDALIVKRDEPYAAVGEWGRVANQFRRFLCSGMRTPARCRRTLSDRR